MKYSSVQRRLLLETDDRIRKLERRYRETSDPIDFHRWAQERIRSGEDPRIVEFERFNQELAQNYQEDLARWEKLEPDDIAYHFQQFMDSLSIRTHNVLQDILRPPRYFTSPPRFNPYYDDFINYIRSPRTTPWHIYRHRYMGRISFYHLIAQMNNHFIPIKPYPNLEEIEQSIYDHYQKRYYRDSPRWRVGEGEEPNFLNHFFTTEWPVIQNAFKI